MILLKKERLSLLKNGAPKSSPAFQFLRFDRMTTHVIFFLIELADPRSRLRIRRLKSAASLKLYQLEALVL